MSFNNRSQNSNETRSDLRFTQSTNSLQSDVQLSRAGSAAHVRRALDDFLVQQQSQSQMQRPVNNLERMEAFMPGDSQR